MCHPEPYEGTLREYRLCVIPSAAEGSLWEYRLCVIPSAAEGSLREYRLCVIPSAAEGSLSEYRQDFNRDPSKARVVLPCLQGVKRARRNRRHMGVCPWQLVAESATQELFTVCLATLTAYSPRAAGQRPVRLAAVPSRRLAQGDTIVTFCHPEPVERSLSEYRQDLNRDPSTSLRFAQDDNEGESHFSIIKLRAQKSHFLQAHPRRRCRQRSRIALKRQCSHARSAPPLPKNLTSLRFSGALLPKPFGS